MFQTAVREYDHIKLIAWEDHRKPNIIFLLYERWDDLTQRFIYVALLEGCGVLYCDEVVFLGRFCNVLLHQNNGYWQPEITYPDFGFRIPDVLELPSGGFFYCLRG